MHLHRRSSLVERMTAGRRTAVLVLLLALVGTGCANGGTAPTAKTVARAPSSAVTQVLTFQAFDDVGLLPNLSRATTVAGSCQGGSIVHPGRADAWRCRAGDTAYDPCFANTTGEELACVVDPWTHEVTTLKPASPLGRAGANRNDPGLPPWYLELGDGARCGRVPPSGYRCDAGREVGEPDTTRPVWTVRPAGEVRTAWY